MEKIDIQDYKTFVDLLTDFAGNPKTEFNDESVCRNIFVTNFMQVLTSVNLDNEDIYKSINTIIQYVITFKIPLYDIYSFFGIDKMSLAQLEYFFNNYFTFIDKKQMQIHNIYLWVINDKTSFGDLVHDSHYIPINYSKNYIKPIVKYDYREDQNKKYFISQLSALKTFYSIKWDSAISNNEYLNKIKNNLKTEEFNKFFDSLISSYDSRIFYLLAVNQSRPGAEVFNLLNNINLENIQLTNNTYTIDSFDKLKQLFINNVSSLDIPIYIEKLSQELYTMYSEDLNTYARRNQKFDLTGYLNRLEPNINDCNINDIWKYVFYTYVYSSCHKDINNKYTSFLSTWINDSYYLKNQLYGKDGIINKIINQDKRFERSF